MNEWMDEQDQLGDLTFIFRDQNNAVSFKVF